MMVVSKNWIPYDSVYEKKLVDALAKLNVRSVKGLRYNLLAARPCAAAVLQRQPRPLALYIILPTAGTSYEEALEELIASRPDDDSWRESCRRRNARIRESVTTNHRGATVVLYERRMLLMSRPFLPPSPLR